MAKTQLENISEVEYCARLLAGEQANWQTSLGRIALDEKGNRRDIAPSFLAELQYNIILRAYDLKIEGLPGPRQGKQVRQLRQTYELVLFISNMVREESDAKKALKTGVEYIHLKNLVEQVKILEKEGGKLGATENKIITKYEKKRNEYTSIVQALRPANTPEHK